MNERNMEYMNEGRKKRKRLLMASTIGKELQTLLNTLQILSIIVIILGTQHYPGKRNRLTHLRTDDRLMLMSAKISLFLRVVKLTTLKEPHHGHLPAFVTSQNG